MVRLSFLVLKSVFFSLQLGRGIGHRVYHLNVPPEELSLRGLNTDPEVTTVKNKTYMVPLYPMMRLQPETI